MTSVCSRRKPYWRIAKVILILVLVFGVLAICFLCLTQVQIDSVSFDESSEWSKYFLSKSGFSTIRMCSHVASRQYIDHISIVGSNRPKEWFEQLGFEDVYEDETVVRTITKTLPDDGSSQRVLVMQHPMMPFAIFYYLPRMGILVYHDP